MRVPGQVSGNETHPEDDPLWDNEEVIELVSKRVPVNVEAQKAKLQERNRASYRKSKSEMMQLRAELEGFVLVGKMSQKDMDKVMLSRLHGQYRLMYQKEILEREGATRHAELMSERNARLSQGEAFEQLRSRHEGVKSHTFLLQENYFDLATALTEIFNPEENATLPNHLERNGIKWPTEPSLSAFFLIYAVSVPIGCWPPDEVLPDVKTAFKAASIFIHPDKANQYAGAFGGAAKMEDIMKTFQASKDLVTNYMVDETISADEKKRYIRHHWETAKYDVFKAMRPNSSTLPPFFISSLVDEAAKKMAQQNISRPQ